MVLSLIIHILIFQRKDWRIYKRKENETVLDFTMGSGSTGVACKNTGRKFIGMELDENYFNIAKERIENEIQSTVKI